VTVSSIVNLISANKIIILTIVIDKSQITLSKLYLLDFQTVSNIGKNQTSIVLLYPNASNNVIVGFNYLYIENFTNYAFTIYRYSQQTLFQLYFSSIYSPQ
jgi:hypothetical protein